MEDKTIIDNLIKRLLEEGFWFTTKNDPTFEEASSYYELDEYGDLTEKAKTKIEKEINAKIGDGAVELDDAIELWIADAASAYKIAYTEYLVTQFEPKQVVDQIEAYEVGKLEESVKSRLREENNKSLNAISDKLAEPNFDAESEAGQIVLKTSDLFNLLSDEGYDVQVSFDNGESQSSIFLGQQGGKVEITITKGNAPIKAFISGNFELDTEILTTLTSILDKINTL